MDLSTYRRQHAELRDLAERLAGLLQRDKLRDDSTPARSALATFVGRLNVHLAIEDDVLYPELLASDNIRLRTVARRFQREMGEIAEVVDAHVKRWPSGRAVQQDAEAFVSETESILETADRRIDSEEWTLFPAAERAARRHQTPKI